MNKTILAIGAHPDDIELGCGGTIKKHILKDNEVYYIIATNGEMGGTVMDRVAEAIKSSEMMCVEDIFFLNLSDSNVQHNGETVGLIDDIIKKIMPSMVYTHSLKDIHQDHVNVAKATLSASRNMKNSILCYEASSTLLGFTPTAFNDISDTFDAKIKCTQKFVSQANRDYMEREVMVNLAKFRGRIINTEYAEAFEVMRLVEW